MGIRTTNRWGGSRCNSPPHYQQPPNYQQPPMQQQYGHEQPYGHGFGPPPWATRARRQYPIETKPFFLTSEFIGAVLAIAGIAITAASSDAFGAWRAWILITAVIVGYMVSRGIAKSGTRSHADDPRENFNPAVGSRRLRGTVALRRQPASVDRARRRLGRPPLLIG